MSSKNNKRHYERFPLEIDAKLVKHDQKEDNAVVNICTDNISAGGALIKTDQSLPKGTNLDMTLILPLDQLKNINAEKLTITISGKVIRSENQGVGIEFDDNFHITHSGMPENSQKNGPKKNLTKREMQIFELIASGQSNKEISKNLSIGLSTVKTHIYNLYKKIGVTNRFQAILYKLEHSDY